MSTISELNRKLNLLSFVDLDKRVLEAKRLVRAERQPKIDEIKKEIEALRSKRPLPKPRWPENVPENVLTACKKFWSGTTELYTFRIHCWNDKGVCTGYPSGGYSNNGGWHPTPATFYFISLTKFERDKPVQFGDTISGRQTSKVLMETLEKFTKL